MPAKKSRVCPIPQCQRPPLHRGRHGAPTSKESALGRSAYLLYAEVTPPPPPATTTVEPKRSRAQVHAEVTANAKAIDVMARKMVAQVVGTRRTPIKQAQREVAADPATKKIAEALPKDARKKCPACDRQFVARPSGLLPAHKVDGQLCSQKAPPPPRVRRPAAKKVACVVSAEDGCGRMIGIFHKTGRVSSHIRKDGTPCPGSDLVPGSPLPVAKRRSTPPLNPKTGPSSRPLHDRSDRSAYHDTPDLERSLMKARDLRNVVAQYGWEPTQRVRPDGITVELTLVRGPETIHIYWVKGVCAGEDITYTVEDRVVKLRNASAVKVRAALEPTAAMAEVKQKMENYQRVRRQAATLNAERIEAQTNNRKDHATELSGKLALLHDEQVVKELQGKWVSWQNRISKKEEIGLLPRDPRKIQINMSILEDDRIIKFSDPEVGFRAFRLSALTRLQSTAMRRRKADANEER